VHTHAYFHVGASKPFHKEGPRAFDVFIVEDVGTRGQKNTASGKPYNGAVNRRHFYVYVDKFGSVFEWRASGFHWGALRLGLLESHKPGGA